MGREGWGHADSGLEMERRPQMPGAQAHVVVFRNNVYASWKRDSADTFMYSPSGLPLSWACILEAVFR